MTGSRHLRHVRELATTGIMRQQGECRGFKGLAAPSAIVKSRHRRGRKHLPEMFHDRAVVHPATPDDHIINVPGHPPPRRADRFRRPCRAGRQQIFDGQARLALLR